MLLFCLLGVVTGLTKDEDLKVVGNPHIAPKPMSADTAGGQVSNIKPEKKNMYFYFYFICVHCGIGFSSFFVLLLVPKILSNRYTRSHGYGMFNVSLNQH